MQFNDEKICEPLKTGGLHFFNLDVSSLLSKSDELRDITNLFKISDLRYNRIETG